MSRTTVPRDMDCPTVFFENVVMSRFLFTAIAVKVCAIGVFAAADAPAPAQSQDELALKRAGIPADGPGLLDFFRRRTPGPQEQTTLKLRAAQLGSTAYPTRLKATDDLIKAGRSALPFLRDIAIRSDAETARRAHYCIGVIEQNTRAGLTATASRVLVQRNPPGAAETLLGYLPFADEPWIEEDIRQSLKRIAYVDGKALASFETALTDASPQRRGAAAVIVGHSPDARQRKLAKERLDDASSEVRFLAASALLAFSDADGVPTLIALLTSDRPELAARCEDLLFRLAGENGPPVWHSTADNNSGRSVQLAWIDWWKANQAKIDWKSVRSDEPLLGWTLIVENQRPDGGSRIFEINGASETRFQLKIQNPVDAQWLPGGKFLVGDSAANVIYEMDTHGGIGWIYKGVSPTSIQRLPNGNTVFSTYQSISEVTRDRQTVFTHKTPGHTYHARKTADGHYIWIDACGEIGAIDSRGKEIGRAKIAGTLAWGSIERLRNGRYLVALGGVGKVQEVDLAGKVYWEKSVSNPNRAVRLPNGNTLVASHGDSTVYEFDPAGNERWKHVCVGRPFAAIRR